MDSKNLEKTINGILSQNAVYGKLYKTQIIEDKVAQLTVDRDILNLREYREFYKEPRIPFYSKWLMPNEVKTELRFNDKVIELKTKENKDSESQISSGYAFACFSSFEAVEKFKKYSKKFIQKQEHFRSMFFSMSTSSLEHFHTSRQHSLFYGLDRRQLVQLFRQKKNKHRIYVDFKSGCFPYSYFFDNSDCFAGVFEI